jgi:hypothetical protein
MESRSLLKPYHPVRKGFKVHLSERFCRRA